MRVNTLGTTTSNAEQRVVYRERNAELSLETDEPSSETRRTVSIREKLFCSFLLVFLFLWSFTLFIWKVTMTA